MLWIHLWLRSQRSNLNREWGQQYGIFTIYTDHFGSISIRGILIISCDLGCICCLCKGIAFNEMADLVRKISVDERVSLVGGTGIDKRAVLVGKIGIDRIIGNRTS